MNSEREKHPSYGMLEISRISTNPKMPLFGSSILHGELIAIRVKHACVDRHLNRNWYFPEDTITEVYMSYSQFTQAIMSMNTSGVPVTIKYENGKVIQPKEELKNTKELFTKEFQKSINTTFEKTKELLYEANELAKSKTPLNKQQKERLKSLAYSINQDIQSNMAFVVNSFEEQIDQTITEATGEIESFFNSKITSLGIDALQKEILALPDIEATE